MEVMGTVDADNLKNKLGSKMPPIPDQASHLPMKETFAEIKAKTAEAYDSSIQIVRQNPVKSLAIALGVGMAAGYLLRRR